MSIDLGNFLSGILGSGLILGLCSYIISRVVTQVDTLADKVEMIHIELSKAATRLEAFENYAQDGANWKERIVRIESHLKLSKH